MTIILAALAAAATPSNRPLAPLATFPSAKAVVPGVAAQHGKPTREQVVAAVKAEWPKYDTRHAGKLGPLEFSTWVMRANGVTVAPSGASTAKASGVKPVTAMNASSRAFAAADADHDGGVTPDEMAAFLMRQP
jgi:hypothetical protein